MIIKNQSEIFQILKSAILSKKKIKFEYSNSKGEQMHRKVEPLKLCSKGEHGICMDIVINVVIIDF